MLCRVPSCTNDEKVRGVCNAHYLAISRGKLTTKYLLPRKKPQGRPAKHQGSATYARHAVDGAIRAGKLERPTLCERCGRSWPTQSGRTGIQAHHHKGYDFPLDVVWLCIPCHRDADNQRFFGETNGRATLTDEQVDQIRWRAAKGELNRELAKEFGVSTTTIRNYVQHKVR